MNTVFAVLAKKEFRALLPIWAASALTIAADPWLRGSVVHSVFPVGVFAYIVGSLALGAHVIGHEFSNRTLPALLVQPCRRSTMLLAKAGVLAALLTGFTLVAWPVLFDSLTPAVGHFPKYRTLLLPPLGALFLVPYLTMRLRNQLAGAIFAASLPGTIYVGTLLVGFAIYGTAGDSAHTLAVAVITPALTVVMAAGAVLSARAFLTLEVVEGGAEELRLPRWLAIEDRTGVRPPVWALVKKELRLQQMTFALAGLYALIWAGLTTAASLNATFAKELPIKAIGMLYFALLPLLMGALASAQERQLGTLESQAMLPMSFRRQWAVKAGVVLVLALILSVVLPWSVLAPPQLSRSSIWPIAISAVLLSTWSLYLSSWSPSGIVALALTLPATAAAVLAFRWIDNLVWRLFQGSLRVPAGGGHFPLASPNVIAVGIVASLVAVLLYFAAANHRSMERRFDRLALQSLGLIACVAAADLAAFLFLP